MTIQKCIFLAFLLSLTACDNLTEKELIGQWQGFEILEEGTPLDIDPAVIRFEFLPDKTYSFYGTLKYKEEGTFKVKADYLYTTNDLEENAGEKAVLIEQLGLDTLALKMNEQGKSRLLKLKRVAQ